MQLHQREEACVKQGQTTHDEGWKPKQWVHVSLIRKSVYGEQFNEKHVRRLNGILYIPTNGISGKNANTRQIMERRFGRPLPCQRNIERTVASPRTCCVCPTLIIPELPFCKALVRLPPSEPTRSRSMTSLLGTAPNRVWHLAEPSFFAIAMKTGGSTPGSGNNKPPASSGAPTRV